MNNLDTNNLNMDEENHITNITMPTIAEVVLNEHKFGIRAANIDEQRNSASMLINKMYAWRGYSGNHQIRNEPNKITLTASDKEGKTIGTLSLGLDSHLGLLADEGFKDCIDPYRKLGKVCEITKLAVSPEVKSKEILASLFHIAFLYARDIHQCTETFIEVNPRHQRFYKSILGFEIECESRPNLRVDAPAVLLRMNSEYGTQKIAEGKIEKNHQDRSLFPYFFSKHEEAGIVQRLKNME